MNIILAIICIAASADVIETSVKVTTGAFWKPLFPTINYEGSVPLIYQTTFSKLQWSNGSLPKDPDCNKLYTAQCRTVKSIADLGENFREEFEMLQDDWMIQLLPQDRRDKRALDFVGEFLSWCCGTATQHSLDAMAMDGARLQKSIEKIHRGLGQTIQNFGINSKNFKNYEDQVRTAFERVQVSMNILKKQYLENQKDDNNLLDSILYLNFKNLERLVMIGRAMYQQEIINTCRTHHLPPSIIKPETLRKDLVGYSKTLQKNNRTLAIPLTDLIKYYQLPIVDCVFSTDSLTVNVKVPIITTNDHWQLYELVTTPFGWRDQTCIIQHEHLYLAVSGEGKLRTIAGTGLHHCRPFHDQLCLLPRVSADPMYGPKCIIKMYTGATVNELNHLCPFSCHASTATVITEFDENRYIITHPSINTTIVCPQKKIPLPTNHYSSPGAVQLDLPCDCALHSDEETLIHSRYPCDLQTQKSLNIIHVLPAMWSKLHSLIMETNQHHHPVYANISECLNEDWTFQIPHINITRDEAYKTLEDAVDEAIAEAKTYANTYGKHGNYLMLAWNVLLTIVVIYLTLKSRTIATMSVLPVARAEDHATVWHTMTLVTLVGMLMLIITMFYVIAYKYRLLKRIRSYCPCCVRSTREVFREGGGEEGILGQGRLVFEDGKEYPIVFSKLTKESESTVV